MKTHVQIPLLVLVLLVGSELPPATAFAQGTAFTYQGRLIDGAAPANGVYDLQFTIYDSGSAGLAVGSPLTNAPTAVSNGLFTVALDFGNNIFTGPTRWLEIAVRTNGSVAAYQTLSPRQPFTAAPYAITAGSVTGVIPSASLSGSYSSVVTFSNSANTFVGNGAGISNVNATALSGLAAGNFWQTAGNSGTSPTNGNFLGTKDFQPLEFRVNGTRALRVEPDSTGGGASTGIPNIIGGFPSNTVEQPGSAGNVIVGGGSALANPGPDIIHSNSQYIFMGAPWGSQAGPNLSGGAIVSGFNNLIGNGASLSFIGSGYNNSIYGYNSFIGGGRYNVIQSNALWSVIAGGTENTIGSNAFFATIGGGGGNVVNESGSTIAGGQINHIEVLADHSFIGGGDGNIIFGSTGPAYSAIAGGQYNTIQSNVSYGFIGGGISNVVAANTATIGGGSQNNLGPGALDATIGGGQGNSVISPNTTISGGIYNFTGTNTYFGTIGGGGYSLIGSNSSSSTISGGYSNTITNNTLDSVISGGSYNRIGDTSPYTTIAGGRINTIGDNATAAAIGGGFNNYVGFAAAYASIPGGYNNYAGSPYSFAAGYQAQASQIGTFVWSDPGSGPFTSTGTNQFLIRAAGGVGINTNAPSGAALNVAGTVRATAFQGDGSGLQNINIGVLGNYVFAYNSGVQAVTTGNTYQDVNFLNDAQLSGWAHAAGTSQYTSGQTGLYLVQYYGQFVTTAANGTNAQMRVMLNGVEIPGSHSVATVTSLTEVSSVSKALIVNANAADVLSLQFTGSGTGIRLSGSGNSTLTVTRIQ